ncbi:hypothetical protein Taro_015648 [Colocasia esculenta]|uniref:Uncharacterized protein n=1 Tax=Colocasia esculenta TaxID=4460 RepID=A0A843UMU0_COLES|nr:hypothetical protein [Colocasia esculenta]
MLLPTRDLKSSKLAIQFLSAEMQTERTKHDVDRARRVSKGSSLAPMTESHKYTVNHGTLKQKEIDDYVSESARMIAETYDRMMADRYAESSP